MRATFFSDAQEAQDLIAKDRPSLALLEHDPPRMDGMATCREVRAHESDHKYRLPVVMVAAQDDQATGAAAGVTDWLIKPLTSSYARTRIRAWVLRTECRWIRARTPSDEQQRIASLRGIGVLDTAPEERFDRITRLPETNERLPGFQWIGSSPEEFGSYIKANIARVGKVVREANIKAE